MEQYVVQLVTTLVVCQVATVLSPTGSRGYLRTVCALVTVLTVFSPLLTLLAGLDGIEEKITSFFTVEGETGEEGSLEAAAYIILTHASERYGFDTVGAEITFCKDGDTVTEILLFFEEGNGYNRDRLQGELEEKLGIPVHIFIERKDEDG